VIGRHFGTARGFLLCELVAAPAALLIALTGPGPRLALLVVGRIAGCWARSCELARGPGIRTRLPDAGIIRLA